jgi:hypothetical protein
MVEAHSTRRKAESSPRRSKRDHARTVVVRKRSSARTNPTTYHYRLARIQKAMSSGRTGKCNFGYACQI